MFSEQAAQRAHTLLSPPSASNATFTRVPVATYTNSSQPFRLGERSFNRQYAHIYATRLIQMRPFLVSRAQQQWGEWIWGMLPPSAQNSELSFDLPHFPVILGKLASLSPNFFIR